MAGGVGHTGGLTNRPPWRGRCQAGFSNTGGHAKPVSLIPAGLPCLERGRLVKKYYRRFSGPDVDN